MRRLIALALLVGCASMAPIPGGPEDKTPPKIVSTTPDTNAVNFHGGAVTFHFDEVVSDRSGPSQDLNGLFLISPRDGAPRINWHRDHIDVRPKGKWRPNTAYTVTMLPGLADLSNNQIKTTNTLVFSTGPTIPPYGVLGRVFDWASEAVAPKAVVEAIQRPDSIVYIGVTDSTGQFHVGPFAAGKYTVIAYIDQNHNMTRDPGELWDSTQVNITSTQPYLEMLAAKRDTVGPVIESVAEDDSTTIRIVFDKPLLPGAPIDTTHFRVMTADSAHLTLLTARTLEKYKADIEQARADSTRLADSLAALRDTTKKKPTPPPAPPAPARGDTTTKIKPSRPAPSTTIILGLALGSKLPPNKQIRVTASDMVNLLGYKNSSTRVFATPKPPDSTKVVKALKAPGDSSHAKPPLPPDTSHAPPPKKPGGGGR